VTAYQSGFEGHFVDLLCRTEAPSVKWWAHLDSNQGPTDYESARDVRGYWSFAEHLCF
jgi:hypothetical protein